MTNTTMKFYPVRHVARIVIEAATPLAVGSGAKSFETDSEVALDVNDLPFISGSTLAGVLRHAAGARANLNKKDKELAEGDLYKLWGYGMDDKGRGSQIIFSDARILGSDGKPVDGLQTDLDDSYYKALRRALPIRQHVRIGYKGTAEKGGKFDNRIVFQGARFCFEIEVQSHTADEQNTAIDDVINLLRRAEIRFGSGTRNGYGEVKLVSASSRTYDLAQPADLAAYESLSSGLQTSIPGGKTISELSTVSASGKYEDLSLSITPRDFFLFGSGEADLSGESDMSPCVESVISWSNGKPTIVTGDKKRIVVPATSVKGALAHRTAFYYNKAQGIFADGMDDKALKANSGQGNKAVQNLFGYQDDKGDLHPGRVFISDILLENVMTDKLLNHVSIDRFTGGAIDGALFTERVARMSDNADPAKKVLNLKIFVAKPTLPNVEIDENAGKTAREEAEKRQKQLQDEYDLFPAALDAFKLALNDLKNGLLPLGGGVNRGHGTFVS